MRRFLFLLAVLQILVLSTSAAEVRPDCALCIGLVSDTQLVPAQPVPMTLRLTENDLATRGAWLDSLSIAQRKNVAVTVDFSIDPEGDPLLAVEQKTKHLVEWSRLHGPFDVFATSVRSSDPAVAAYALKRLAVTAQGMEIAERIGVDAQDVASLSRFFDAEAHPYFDVVIAPANQVKELAAWLSERDPSKKIYAIVTPSSANPAFDAAAALADGAQRAYIEIANEARVAAAIAQINSALRGDYAYDATARATVLDPKGNTTGGRLLTFVRGEDLRSVIIPSGDAAAAYIVSLPHDDYAKPRRTGAAGEQAITDTGSKGGRLLVGFPPTREPMAMIVDRATRSEANVTKETINIATRREITVEEIIRNHQAYKAYQESIAPRYIARNTTKLRFAIGTGGDSVEATIAGDYFSEPNVRSDWVWQDFFINGVRWKYGRIPELPIVQPEKVTQLPLDLHLTNEYRYTLVGERDLGGYKTYEVRFEPPRNASADLPLYRGTVWIDSRTWARIRIAMVQLHLTGEVLSNEERVEFRPFAKGTNQVLSPAEVATQGPRELVWLPSLVVAQQVVSAAGRSTAVERETTFENFRIDPPAFADALQSALRSDARMVRETSAGLRYLEKRGDGERVVKEGFDTSRVFMLGGVHHDSGLEFPVVPLGGIDYFNFNLAKKGIQTNVFFAGVILAANATHPNVANTRTNVGADLFAMAIPTENTMYRNGQELPDQTIKSLPAVLTLRAGHPVFEFGKIDVAFTAAHLTYQRADDTAENFIIPEDTFVLAPSINAEYARWGYNVSAYYDYNRRTSWSPWGDLTEYRDEQRSFSRFGGSIGKSFYLPKFQRLGIDLNYLGGQRLDRFSKYELGFFGAQRVHGIRSGSVRAENAILGHLSYGFVFSDMFRLEALYDHAIVTDRVAGLRAEAFQGVGIAGQTVGPYGTLVRLDIGKTIGRNAQDGFVANVVFLKLF